MPLFGAPQNDENGWSSGYISGFATKRRGRSLNDVRELEHEVDLESAEAPKTVGPN
jgi:hypothetical protein